eukprot:Nk52_evm1s1994 gene=Nk52_evmTU1s1994
MNLSRQRYCIMCSERSKLYDGKKGHKTAYGCDCVFGESDAVKDPIPLCVPRKGATYKSRFHYFHEEKEFRDPEHYRDLRSRGKARALVEYNLQRREHEMEIERKKIEKERRLLTHNLK